MIQLIVIIRFFLGQKKETIYVIIFNHLLS